MQMTTSPEEANKTATNGGRYRYYSECLLGSGAFGSVLKALDGIKIKVVAIKIVKTKKSIKEYFFWKTPTAIKDTRKEAELLFRLQHDNIVGIWDHFEFKSGRTIGMAIVMEYCPQGNLQSRLELLSSRDKRLTLSERFRWYEQLATALEFIHWREVVHRDLKPANILIDARDNLKIADIGMAKAFYDGKAAYNEIDSKFNTFYLYMETFAGTPAYMAPEVEDSHYSSSCDVFSLGLIMLVICEIPKQPIPSAKFGSLTMILGHLLHVSVAARREKASSLLHVQRCPPLELELFDRMLLYSHHDRPKMSVVIDNLEDIKIRSMRDDKKNEDKSEDKSKSKSESQSSCVLL